MLRWYFSIYLGVSRSERSVRAVWCCAVSGKQ